jgi:hypothetical protein
MELVRFIFEDRHYVVSFQHNTAFLVWTEIHDDFHWGRIIKSVDLTGQTTNPVKLVRKIWQIVKAHIHQNNLPYFEIEVADRKRSQIYMRFLTQLPGYQSFKYGNNIFVLKQQYQRVRGNI